MFGDSVNPGGSDAETGNQDHTTPSDPTTLAEAPAFADADMMAALGELSDGYTVNWRTLRPDKWPTAQTELTEWVEWIIYRYALDSRQLPSCWMGHGALVEELSALHSAWQADFHPADTGAGPIGWHERFELALGRIKNRWYGGECGRAHQPPNLGRPTNTEPVPPWHSPIRPGPAPDTAPDPMTQTGSAADEEKRKRETP